VKRRGPAEVRKDSEQRALESLQDRLSKLAWDEMQELVAGLLRSMEYKTRVSPAGPDRGRDIIASPDGFGFQPLIDFYRRLSALTVHPLHCRWRRPSSAAFASDSIRDASFFFPISRRTSA